MGKRRKRCGATTRPQSHRARSPDSDERRHYSPLTLLLLGQRQTKGSSAARMGQLNNQDGATVATGVVQQLIVRVRHSVEPQKYDVAKVRDDSVRYSSSQWSILDPSSQVVDPRRRAPCLVQLRVVVVQTMDIKPGHHSSWKGALLSGAPTVPCGPSSCNSRVPGSCSCRVSRIGGVVFLSELFHKPSQVGDMGAAVGWRLLRLASKIVAWLLHNFLLTVLRHDSRISGV
ncbi:hypothetical protein TIFTF001_009807 [Ficus carica]|uniref:Uncharacterized protein n=1 Tax=Ficus carica TaxID=3494 RepID=A0AA87ZQK6_FICCA|nr:hypothetical protein TIFTF001_009807 [Ficus carica]